MEKVDLKTMELKTGLELIQAERSRQIQEEGFDGKHDEQHTEGELAIAAACYAVEGTCAEVVSECQAMYLTGSNRDGSNTFVTKADAWPWSSHWDKRDKHTLVKRLTIAGALIAAALDRLMIDEYDRRARQE